MKNKLNLNHREDRGQPKYWYKVFWYSTKHALSSLFRESEKVFSPTPFIYMSASCPSSFQEKLSWSKPDLLIFDSRDASPKAQQIFREQMLLFPQIQYLVLVADTQDKRYYLNFSKNTRVVFIPADDEQQLLIYWQLLKGLKPMHHHDREKDQYNEQFHFHKVSALIPSHMSDEAISSGIARPPKEVRERGKQ